MSSPAIPAPSASAQDLAPSAGGGTLLVCLPTLSSGDTEPLRRLVANLGSRTRLLLAAPEGTLAQMDGQPGTALTLTLSPVPSSVWVLSAAEYAAGASLAQAQAATATVILGSDPGELASADLEALVEPVLRGEADLTLPRYRTAAHEALVSGSLLHPLTQTLFGSQVRLPLPLDVAFSAAAAVRLLAAARRFGSASDGSGLLWPVAEAAVAGYRVREVALGPRSLPQPDASDLNTLLGEVLGSLFADIELKAAFWQRGRSPQAVSRSLLADQPAGAAELTDVREMIEIFRNAYANLQQIWGLVLPPHSLLALKKLSQTTPEDFALAPALWARTVYEFILSFHLRTLNRGHLLGALTPLYMAWVASYLRCVDGDAERAARYIGDTVAGFEAEKPYLVSRWRWPDRFNP